MGPINTEDWLDVLERTDYTPDFTNGHTYQSYRFVNLSIDEVTIENYEEKLVGSLAEQVSMFIPHLAASKHLTSSAIWSLCVVMKQARQI